MDRLENAAYFVARALSRAGLLLLLAFAFATLCDAVSRSLFDYPIEAVRDVGNLVIAVAISACFPQLLMERGNIAITFISGLLSLRENRLLDVIAATLTAAVMLAFGWEFYLHAGNLAQASETTPLLAIPKAPFWYVVDINFWVAALIQLLVVVQVAMGRSIPAIRRGGLTASRTV